MAKKHLEKHYKDVGERYDRLYQRIFGESRTKVASRLAEIIREKKRPQTIADVGGGTGATIELLKEQVEPMHRFLLVEPFTTMSDNALVRSRKPDEILNITAESFVDNRAYFNRIDLMICQEMIHHIADMKSFFKGVHHTLVPDGTVVIITRPMEAALPFGRHAKAAWLAQYGADPKEIPGLLAKQGFSVEAETYVYPITISKADWLELIGPKPLFSYSITPEERREDIAEIEAREDVLRFNDTVLFFIGKKNRSE